jgi:hypothetical protein
MVASRPPLIYPDNAVWPFDYLSLLPNGQGLSEVDSGGLDLLTGGAAASTDFEPVRLYHSESGLVLASPSRVMRKQELDQKRLGTVTGM